MTDITIAQDAAEYILDEKKMSRPNVIIYREVVFRAASAPSGSLFSTKVKVKDGEEPDELFTVVGNSHRIPIWVERGLLPQMNSAGPFTIILSKRIVKRLKIVSSSQAEKCGHDQGAE